MTAWTRIGVALRCLGTTLGALVLASSALAGGPDRAAVTRDAPPTNRFIVHYSLIQNQSTAISRSAMAGGPQAQAAALSQVLGQNVRHVRAMHDGAQIFRTRRWHSPDDLQKLLDLVAADPGVEYAEPDLLLQPMLEPNDQFYPNQWHYYEATGGLNLPTAWDTTTGGGVVVAVIDTGYLAHPDLAPNLLPGYDMISDTFVSVDGDLRDSDATDPGDWSTAGQCGPLEPARNSSWHGTHVAGTVAAVSDNSIGVAGVAFGARVVPIRALGRCGGFTSDIADGIVWAAGGTVPGVPANANPAAVINMSLGGQGPCLSTTQNAIDLARANGATVVVASGNSATDASGFRPANCAGVIAVASTDRLGGRAYYSNFGADVDVAAPGGDVTTAGPDGVLSTVDVGTTTPAGFAYAYYQGTSMAAPHVAGLAALMYSVNPSLTPDEVETAIVSSARSFPASCSQCGSGIADAVAALAAVNDIGTFTPLVNGVAATGLAANVGGGLQYGIAVPSGARNLRIRLGSGVGASGDADLYVRFGSEPDTETYTCRPYLTGNNESCNFPAPQAGTHRIMVYGFSAFSEVSLLVSYEAPPVGGPPGFGFVDDIAGAVDTWNHFSIDVPPDMARLNVVLSGGTGDADLYVREGTFATESDWVCRPFFTGNLESCTITNPGAGTWFFGLRGFEAFSGVRLDVAFEP